MVVTHLGNYGINFKKDLVHRADQLRTKLNNMKLGACKSSVQAKEEGKKEIGSLVVVPTTDSVLEEDRFKVPRPGQGLIGSNVDVYANHVKITG